MKTKLVLAALAAVVVLAVAPSAFAHDYCVANPACVGAGGTGEPDVQAALTAADGTPESDRVLIGPGTFAAPTTAGFSAVVSPVEVIGAGADATTLTGPSDTGTVLQLSKAGSRVADLSVFMPANTTNATKYGIDLTGGLAERVKVTVDAGMSTAAAGIYPRDGSVVQDSDIDMSATPAPAAIIGINAQAGTTVRRSTITGRYPLRAQGAHVHFDRDWIRTTNIGIEVSNSADDIEATNSIIQLTGAGTGVYAGTGNNLDAGIVLRGDTIVGNGTAGSYGVIAGSNTAHTSTIKLESSIVRGFSTSLRATAIVPGAAADLAVEYSDYNPAIVSTAGPATITPGVGNINADPLFAGASDFHLLKGSPAIDAGNPADLGDVADFDGNLRTQDGDDDGIARRDIGAFELPAKPVPPPPPAGDPAPGGDPAPAPAGNPAPAAGNPAPVSGPAAGQADRLAPLITKLVAHAGGRLSFRLSESARVTVTIVRRTNDARLHRVATLRRPFAAGAAKLRLARIGRKALRPGRYIAKLVATDAAGNRSRTYSVRFRIAA